MIDIRHLRDNSDEYKRSAKLRGVTIDIDELLKVDKKRIELIGQVEKLRSELNLKGKPTEAQLKNLQEVKMGLEVKSKELEAATYHYEELLWQVPNLLANETPEGNEEDKRQEKTWGLAEKRNLKDHVLLGEENDWIDFERGAKVAGSKFYFTKGPLARLSMAVMHYAMDKASKKGFTPMLVPHMVNSRVAAGTGFLPRGEERQIYKVEGEDLNLIATAELPLTGYHCDEILDLNHGPILYVGYSPCYRMEAGAYGKHSKGLFRTHQFEKIEMYVYCKPKDSEFWHQKILQVEEEILQELEIPYRVVRIAAGDLGAAAAKKYDLEYWSPVDGEYREITSCSNCTDFQARRLNIRYRTDDGKINFVHTLNGTAAVTSRVPVAILENHQTEGGKITIPKVLRQYMGTDQL